MHIVAASASCCHGWQGALVDAARQPADDGASMALLLFPKLALGLSGFETGVAVMPLVAGRAGDTEASAAAGRIRNTKKLLRTAALIMSVLLHRQQLRHGAADSRLMRSSRGGAADGRALAYLAHEISARCSARVYDLSTIAILWFAGASAMAGLLNLVPRYLPRYGMAPEWARATRPLVVIITGITFVRDDRFRRGRRRRRAARTRPACWC